MSANSGKTLKDQLSKHKINKRDRAPLEKFRGKLTTRFAPEPSGSLHIGHCKAIVLNYKIATEFDGRFLLRLDNTNPEKESIDFENGILQDVATLGAKYDQLSRTSDYFPLILSYADSLVDQGLAYVDDTPPNQMKAERDGRIDSANRDNSIDVNQALWADMKSGSKTDAVLRIKMDMQNVNGCLRDPTIYRFIDKPHQHTGDTYKVYPTYDFACPIVDHVEGVTHVYRSVEFTDRDSQYLWILKLLGLPKIKLNSFGKVIFQDIVTSKRKINALIQSGDVSGWDDPRLLTVKGALRRGMCLEAIIDFAASMGFSKNNVNMTTDKLWAVNKKFVDKMAVRYVAIPTANLVEYTVDFNGYDPNMKKEIRKVHRNPSMGTRPVSYDDTVFMWDDEVDATNDGEEITLMNWGNAFIDKTNRVLKLNLDGDFKTTNHKMLWVPKTKSVPLRVVTYGDIGDDPVVEDYLAEDYAMNIQKDDLVQLFKLRFYRCDSVSDGDGVITLIKT